MKTKHSGRIVILSGPSCVGKSPLVKALDRLYPELRESLQPIVLYNTRAPRPGEKDGVDYHFATREQIDAFRDRDDHAVLDVRGDLQALDLGRVAEMLDRGDAIFEGNPYVGRVLQTHPALADVARLGVFLAPISQEEIRSLKDPQRHVVLADLVTDLMRRKLLRRTQRQKGILSLKDLENIERRAGNAFNELREACHFQHVIPNHDGEDSDHWDAFYYPLGDARKALLAFVALVQGQPAEGVEQWAEGLLD